MSDKERGRNHQMENFRPQTPPKAPQNYRPDTTKPGGDGKRQGNYVPPTSDNSTPPPMPKKK